MIHLIQAASEIKLSSASSKISRLRYGRTCFFSAILNHQIEPSEDTIVMSFTSINPWEVNFTTPSVKDRRQVPISRRSVGIRRIEKGRKKLYSSPVGYGCLYTQRVVFIFLHLTYLSVLRKMCSFFSISFKKQEFLFCIFVFPIYSPLHFFLFIFLLFDRMEIILLHYIFTI